MTDRHLWTLAEYCPFLLELDLGDCTSVTDAGIAGRRPVNDEEGNRIAERRSENDEQGNSVAGYRQEHSVGIASLACLHSLNLSRFKVLKFYNIVLTMIYNLLSICQRDK